MFLLDNVVKIGEVAIANSVDYDTAMSMVCYDLQKGTSIYGQYSQALRDQYKACSNVTAAKNEFRARMFRDARRGKPWIHNNIKKYGLPK